MRTILHLIDTSGPGGAETVFLNLVEAFDQGEYRSVSLVPRDSWVGSALQAQERHVKTCDPRGSINVSYLKAIARIARAEGVDLIQAHFAGPSIYAGVYASVAQVPLVTIVHGSVDFSDIGRLRRAKIEAINRGSSSIVAVSEHLRLELVDKVGLDPAKLRVIHNGVDQAAFTAASRDDIRRELELPSEAFVVCSIGNIRPAKGYDVLVRAARQLKDARPETHFIVAGQPKAGLFDELLALRKELDVEDRVHFLGFRSDPAAILSSADVFLLPSTSEGFSISTVEAMASGLPVVATRSGGPEEIISDGVDGRLVPPRDPDAIADAIRDLVVDPALRADFGRRGRATVDRRFSLSAMVADYRGLYESILGGRTRSLENSEYGA